MMSYFFQNSQQSGISKTVLQILIVLFFSHPCHTILSSFHVFLVRQYLINFKARSIPDRLGVFDILCCFILSLVSAIPTNKENQFISERRRKQYTSLKNCFYREGVCGKLLWATRTSRTAW